MFLRAPPAVWIDPLRRGCGKGAAGVLAVLLWCHSASSYAEGTPPAVPALPAVGVSTSAFVQGLIGLIVIIALLLVTLAALKRWGGQFGGVSTTGMKVVSGLSVGTRERILLVEVGDTWLVVGVTASQIRTLHTLPKNSLPELAASPNKPVFAQWLSTVMERQKK